MDLLDTLRYRDNSNYRWRSGVVAFNADCSKVLLVDRLSLPCDEDDPPVTIPAGGIEPGETPVEAAIREAHEEGGIIHVGPVKFLCWVHDHTLQYRTAMFAMYVGELMEDGFEDASVRKRFWVPTDVLYANLQRFVKTPVAGTLLPALRVHFGHPHNLVDHFSMLSAFRGLKDLELAAPGPVVPAAKIKMTPESHDMDQKSDSPCALHFDFFPSSSLGKYVIQCSETHISPPTVHHSDGISQDIFDVCATASDNVEKMLLTLNGSASYSVSLTLAGVEYSRVPVLAKQDAQV